MTPWNSMSIESTPHGCDTPQHRLQRFYGPATRAPHQNHSSLNFANARGFPSCLRGGGNQEHRHKAKATINDDLLVVVQT